MCNSTQKLTLCRHFNVILGCSNTYTYSNGENSEIVTLCALRFNETDVWRFAGVHCMLRIAKIVVIYKNNIEENINRFSCCSEYTYCLHLLPWVAKVQLALPVVLRRCGERREWGMQSLLFFQDNAACFPLIRHEFLCSLCLFIFTIPIINFKIATLATNDM